MPRIFRSMKHDGEDMPLCGPSSRCLGARLHGDVMITDDGYVDPETGGMSVAIGEIGHLPRHRRPKEEGGFGEDPVWWIDSEDLPDTLKFRPDPRNPSRHGFVEPIERMTLDEYQTALATSRGFWSRA